MPEKYEPYVTARRNACIEICDPKDGWMNCRRCGGKAKVWKIVGVSNGPSYWECTVCGLGEVVAGTPMDFGELPLMNADVETEGYCQELLIDKYNYYRRHVGLPLYSTSINCPRCGHSNHSHLPVCGLFLEDNETCKCTATQNDFKCDWCGLPTATSHEIPSDNLILCTRCWRWFTHKKSVVLAKSKWGTVYDGAFPPERHIGHRVEVERVETRQECCQRYHVEVTCECGEKYRIHEQFLSDGE